MLDYGRTAGPLGATAGQRSWLGMPGKAMPMPLKGENMYMYMELEAVTAAACFFAWFLFCPNAENVEVSILGRETLKFFHSEWQRNFFSK